MSPRARRVNRKSLKQDPLLNFTSRAMAYVEANSTLAMGIAAAVVLGVVLAVLWARGRTEKSTTADLRAAALVGAYTNGQFDTVLEMATAMQGTYPGTRGALVATCLKGKAELQLGKFSEAEQSFRSYLESSEMAPFYETAAQQGLAASLEGQGRFAEAAETHAKLAQELEGPLADEAALDAARAFRIAGATDQARRLLEALEAKDNVYSRRARIELAVLDNAGATPLPLMHPGPGDTLSGAVSPTP